MQDGTNFSMVAKDNLAGETGSTPQQTVVPTPVPVQTITGSEIPQPSISDIITGKDQPAATATPQPESREAFFQKNWDALNSVLEKNGLKMNLNDNPNFEEMLNPYFESHKVVDYLDNNPRAILDIAKKYFPDRVTTPTHEDEIQQKLIEEFGEGFKPNPDEVYEFGSQSKRYVDRMNQLQLEINAREQEALNKQRLEAQQRQEAMRTEFNAQYENAKKTFNMTDEQIKPYIEKVIAGDPKYNTLENMIKLVMLVDGSLTVMPKTVEGSIVGSIANVNGAPPANKPNSVESWVGF